MTRPSAPSRSPSGLDFADAGSLFAGRTVTVHDMRHAYSEGRFITAGYLGGRYVVLVRTPRATSHRATRKRNVHAAERTNFSPLGRPG